MAKRKTREELLGWLESEEQGHTWMMEEENDHAWESFRMVV